MTNKANNAGQAMDYSADASTDDGRVISWGLQDLKASIDALVEQQRIANIIAIANNVSEDPEVMVTECERQAWLALAESEAPHRIRPEIAEVLGL